MRKTILLLTFLCLCGFGMAQTVSFGQYFEDHSLRMDEYQCGTRDTSHYVFERFVIEPWFGGSRVNLIDPYDLGTNRVKVVDAATNTVIYLHGYNTLFREWQTTDEATRMERCYEESVSVPKPLNKAYIVLEIRDFNGDFVETFSKLYEPDEIFNTTEQRYVFPHYDVLVNGQSNTKVDVAILPEGYTAEEMEKFKSDCDHLVQVFSNNEPFASHINDFNFRAVLAPSEESGTDVPADHKWVRTILNSHFSTFYIDRYCTTRDYFSVKDVAANVPYDQIYILVNSTQYGGSGLFNFYSISTAGNMSSESVIVHEFGHAFAGLADEYTEPNNPLLLLYNLNVEPWEPNITSLVDFDSKWADLVAQGTPIPTPNNAQYANAVGAFEGGGYFETGMYRPQVHCMMRDYAPFCAVCNRTIEAVIAAHGDSLISGRTVHQSVSTLLSVYPNPATDHIDICVCEKDTNADILDVNGVTVMKVKLSDKVNRVDIGSLCDGIYFVSMNGRKVKFVKQR